MRSRPELAVLIQNMAVWPYEASLEFVSKNQEAADALAIEKGIPSDEAMLRLVVAVMEF